MYKLYWEKDHYTLTMGPDGPDAEAVYASEKDAWAARRRARAALVKQGHDADSGAWAVKAVPPLRHDAAWMDEPEE